MIDKETEIYNFIRDCIPEDIEIITDMVNAPSKFPCVYMQQTNSIPRNMTQENDEEYALLTFQFDIYSNNVVGRKYECKQIAHQIDACMRFKNFVRTAFIRNYNPSEGTVYTNDVHDENIDRYILRYEGVASDTHYYRR